MLGRSRSSESQPLDPNNLGGWKQMAVSSSSHSLRGDLCRGKLEMSTSKSTGVIFSEISPSCYIDISSSPRIAETPISDSNANFSFPSDGDAGGIPESCSSTHLLEDDVQFSFKKPERLKLSSKLKNFGELTSACVSCFTRRRIDPRSEYQYASSRQRFMRLALSLRLPSLIVAFIVSFVILCIFSGLTSNGKGDGASVAERRNEWWQHAVMYEIFPASFADTNDDGFGDISGIINHLNYLSDLKVDVIRLGSIFSALDYPVRYKHVIDFNNMDPHLGKRSHFRDLIVQAHERGIRVILDFNPTLTSDQHPWAAHWLLNRNGQYRDFFVSSSQDQRNMKLVEVNGTIRAWLNIDGAWREPIRGFGGHAILNWSNPKVIEKMTETLSYWLDYGVDGFNMKHLENLYTEHDDDFLTVIREWRKMLDAYSRTSGNERIMICSDDFLQATSKNRWKILNEVIKHFDVIDIKLMVNSSDEVHKSYQRIQTVRKSLTKGHVSVFIDNFDNERAAVKMGKKFNDGLNILLMMMPVSVTILYGQELSMIDATDPDTGQVLEDGQLVPMLWSTSSESNTSAITSWLPSPSNYSHRAENIDRIVHRFEKLSSIRRRAFANPHQYHDSEITLSDSDFLVLKVVSAADEEFLIFINFGSQSRLGTDIDTNTIDFLSSDRVKVVASNTDNLRPGQMVVISRLPINIHDVIVVQEV